jgi:translation initiation factor 2 alpha subunit (eIF-2alpha)
VKEATQKFNNAKKVQSFFYPFCDKFNLDMIEFMKMIVWPLERAGDEAFNVFTQAIFEFDKLIKPLHLRQDIEDFFKSELKKKFTPKKVKLKYYFAMTCYSKRGIEDIKDALREGLLEEGDLKVEITLQAAP